MESICTVISAPAVGGDGSAAPSGRTPATTTRAARRRGQIPLHRRGCEADAIIRPPASGRSRSRPRRKACPGRGQAVQSSNPTIEIPGDGRSLRIWRALLSFLSCFRTIPYQQSCQHPKERCLFAPWTGRPTALTGWSKRSNRWRANACVSWSLLNSRASRVLRRRVLLDCVARATPDAIRALNGIESAALRGLP